MMSQTSRQDIPMPRSANIIKFKRPLVLHDIPHSSLVPEWLKPNLEENRYQAPQNLLRENSLLEKTRDMWMFMKWYCQKTGKTKLTQADLEGQAYEVVKAFYPGVVHLQFQMEECHKMLTDQIDWANLEGDQVRIDINIFLPLSVTPGHVTIQTQIFFNKDLDYLRYGSKGSRPALSISKMKAAYYPDFRLELLVPEHIWIDDV
ncbi:hypothetical protein Tco_0134191 [Tanacetum coccineum]